MAADYNFFTEADDSLKCVICLELAKDPKQHEDCGRLFCSECIEKNGNMPCPNCRAENPQYFKDRRSLREIRDIRVRCDNAERGCDWEGTVGILDDHMTKCGFTLVSCPNKCKIEDEESQVMMKDLDDHLTSCPNREYQCVYCQKKGTYASITEEHDRVCIKKVVPCPNPECTLTMEHGLTEKHLQTVCNYSVVACEYANIGCSVKRMRMDMKQHEEDDKSHLRLTLKMIVKLVNTTSSLEDTISVMSREKWIPFNLQEYSMKKEEDKSFKSEPFITSPGGYKMCFKIYPNGVGACKGTHVSVFSQLLKGPYDNNLHWPFLGTVTVYLLNQLADDNHHSVKIVFNTTNNVHFNNGYGEPLFIPHLELSHDQANNTQYLMEDTLYFRAIVEVDQHKPLKPWLHCTHPTQ